MAMGTAQPLELLWWEDVDHVAHAAMQAQLRAVAGDDAGALLPAVLQRVQPEVGQVRCLVVAVDAEDAAHSGPTARKFPER